MAKDGLGSAGHQAEQEGEISLLDIVNFLTGAWKKLAIAAVVGAVLGFGNWYLSLIHI